MQMAQMRALENGRELIRVTSTGITAIVDHHGNIRTRIPSFTAGNLKGVVHARNGTTRPSTLRRAQEASASTVSPRPDSPDLDPKSSPEHAVVPHRLSISQTVCGAFDLDAE